MSNTNSKSIESAVLAIRNAKHLVAFTGAGISVESGIPPFRGEEGIWTKYDPSILDLDKYLRNPETVWPIIRQLFYDFFVFAKPNRAHEVLASMEKDGLLKSIITQNIDNLHQDAGSEHVIEFHGNSKTFACIDTPSHIVGAAEVAFDAPYPVCPLCGALTKPNFIFFGESIPSKAIIESDLDTVKCDVMLVIGSNGEVVPAAGIPFRAKKNGALIIEINPDSSQFTYEISDIILKGKASSILDQIYLA